MKQTLGKRCRRALLSSAIGCCLSSGSTAVPGPPNSAPTAALVTNCDDSGPGSLRDAVASAADGDTIDLSQLSCSTITLTTGAIEILQNSLSIKYAIGTGHTFTIDANGSGRVLHHSGTGSLELLSLSIENGRYDNTLSKTPVAALGGCIYSAGAVYLNYSTVTGCVAYDAQGRNAGGGGVYARRFAGVSRGGLFNNAVYSPDGMALGGGTLSRSVSVGYSTIHGNSVSSATFAAGGGFAALYGYSKSELLNATVDANTADYGGGFFIPGGSVDDNTSFLQLMSSTISGNIARVAAGAGYLRGSASVFYGTIAFNRSYAGAGIALAPPTGIVRLFDTIVADNTDELGNEYDVSSGGQAVTIEGSYDIIQSASALIDVPPDTLTADPLLLPLADNGGLTRTHALSDDSPAIDAGPGDLDPLLCDQRSTGFPRTVGAAADIGSFERQAISDAIFTDGFDSLGSPTC
jgi:hypothetical protein